jgi:hypothetical protein
MRRFEQGGKGRDRFTPLNKRCSTCKLRKAPIAKHFDRRAEAADGFRGQCKKCLRGPYVAKDRERWLLKKYGITTAHYDLLLAKQGGACAICHGLNPNGQRLSVDHCHTTNEVRGLLCALCNDGIGKFQDDTQRMQAAIEYIENAKR